MFRKPSMFVALCALVTVISGCVTARTYVVNKERVDQEVAGQAGNAPVKTRKVIVMEIVEKDKAGSKAGQPAVQPQAAAVTSGGAVASQESNFTLPQSVALAAPVAVVPVDPQVYVVEKDDTLQKIAKKLYGSYGKWTRIYDANRDVIKDPNFLKPGVVLKIPVLELSQGAEAK